MNEVFENIDKLVKSIVALVHPLQIILFGSAARGEMTPDSDLDLLVVMPNGTDRREIMGYLYSQIRIYEMPFDIVVATEEDMVKHKNDIGFIYYYALKEGKVVYAGEKDHTYIPGTLAQTRPK